MPTRLIQLFPSIAFILLATFSCRPPAENEGPTNQSAPILREHRDIAGEGIPLPEGFRVLGTTINDGGRYGVQLAWKGEADETDYLDIQIELFTRPFDAGALYRLSETRGKKKAGHFQKKIENLGEQAFEMTQPTPEVHFHRGNAFVLVTGEKSGLRARLLARALDQRIIQLQTEALKNQPPAEP